MFRAVGCADKEHNQIVEAWQDEKQSYDGDYTADDVDTVVEYDEDDTRSE